MKKEYTKEQIELWGNLNMVVGAGAITAVHVIVLLFGVPALDWFWQGALFFVLVLVGLLYNKQYQQTKEEKEE